MDNYKDLKDNDTFGHVLPDVNALSKEQLVELVTRVQQILWLDVDADEAADVWEPFVNPEKHWDMGFLDMIAEHLRAFDLGP